MKPVLTMLVVSTFFLASCETLKPAPMPPTCPAPPRLPPLDKLPTEVTDPSFLDRLEKRMFLRPGEATTYELRSSGATAPTTGPGLKSRP